VLATWNLSLDSKWLAEIIATNAVAVVYRHVLITASASDYILLSSTA